MNKLRVDVRDRDTWVPTTKSCIVEMIASPNGMKLKKLLAEL